MKKIIYIFLLCMFSITGYCYGNNLMLNQNLPPIDIDPIGSDDDGILPDPIELCFLPGDIHIINIPSSENPIIPQSGGKFKLAFDTTDTVNIIYALV